MNQKRVMFVSVCAGLASWLAPRAILAGHEIHGEAKMAEMQKMPGESADSVKTIWTSVRKREAELADLVKSKQLGKVHEAAFAIRDLVAMLPEKSTTLGPDQKAKLTGNVKFVATLAQRLDTTGDGKDQADMSDAGIFNFPNRAAGLLERGRQVSGVV